MTACLFFTLAEDSFSNCIAGNNYGSIQTTPLHSIQYIEKNNKSTVFKLNKTTFVPDLTKHTPNLSSYG